MPSPHDIHPKWGVPNEEVSCPGCGKLYGFQDRRICKTCSECERCCPKMCGAMRLVTADTFIEEDLGLAEGDFR